MKIQRNNHLFFFGIFLNTFPFFTIFQCCSVFFIYNEPKKCLDNQIYTWYWISNVLIQNKILWPYIIQYNVTYMYKIIDHMCVMWHDMVRDSGSTWSTIDAQIISFIFTLQFFVSRAIKTSHKSVSEKWNRKKNELVTNLCLINLRIKVLDTST